MRFQIAIIRILAEVRPVTADQLSINVGMDTGQVENILDMFKKSGAEVAENGAIVGLILTTRPTPHRFVVNEQELFAWCALDTLFLPAYVGRLAQVISRCPVTRKEIHLLISPAGTQNTFPSSAVISVVTDPSKVPCSTAGADSELCSRMRFFYSRASAESWQKDHPETAILDLDEAFRVARVLIDQMKLTA